MIPLIIIGVLAFLGYKFLGGTAPDVDLPEAGVPEVDLGQMEDNAPSALGMSGDSALGMSADSALNTSAGDVSGQLKDIFGSYSETFSGITDVRSAKEALPKVQSLNDQLGGITGMMDKLPAGIKEIVMGKMGSMIDPIKATLDKVMALPGVGDILKPAVDIMLDKVDLLSST